MRMRPLIMATIALWLAACGRPESGAELQTTSLATTGVPVPQPTQAASTAAEVATLLSTPVSANQIVELTAYVTRIGQMAPSLVGSCPTWIQALTDQPFSGTLQILDTQGTNYPPDMIPALIVPDGDELPHHARLRGHRGDPTYRDCPNADRIFVVDSIDAVFEQHLPDDRQIHAQVADITSWANRADETFGYRLFYPADWQLEAVQDSNTVYALALRSPQYPTTPIVLRVYPGEAHVDQHDLANAPALVRNGRAILQNQLFGVQHIPSLGLPAYRVDRIGPDGRNAVAVVFNAQGHAYELSLQYGYDIPQTILDTFSAMVASFQLDSLPSATPQPLNDTVVQESAFLSEAAIIVKTKQFLETHYPGSVIEIKETRLVSEAEVRTTVQGCDTLQGHVKAFWLVTVYGEMDGALRTDQLAMDVLTGTFTCGGEVSLDAMPTRNPAIRQTSTPFPSLPEAPSREATPHVPAITSVVGTPETTPIPQFPTVLAPAEPPKP